MKTRSIERLVVVACLSGLLAACTGENAADLMTSAKQYLAKNDNKAAVIQLKNALQKDPDLPEARFLLGTALLQAGDATSANVELRKALELNHPQVQAVPVLARSMIATHEYKKLTDQFGATVLSDRQATADLQTSLATAYATQGELDKARAALRTAFEARPDYPEALLVEARLEALDKKIDKALESVNRALSLKPDDKEALTFKGDLLFRVKSDFAGGLAAYRRVVAIDPTHLPARIGLIEGLFAQQDVAGATAQIDELRKIFPDHPQTLYFDAQLAYLKQDYKKADELVQRVLRVAPNNPKVLQLAGAIELRKDSPVRAQDHLNRAMQLAPEMSGARRLLAMSYLRSGQPEKVLGTLEPLLSRNDVDAETLYLAAQAEALTGDRKSAEAHLLRAAKLSPTQTGSRVTIALSHATPGNADAALNEVEAIAAGDKGTYADQVLVNAYLRKGDFDKALKALDSLEKKQPDKPYTANLRGRVQLLRKDVAQARRSFERALAIDPTFVPAAASLAALDLADKQPQAAKKRFDDVLAADPKNIQARLALAGLRARAGGSVEEVAALLAEAVKLSPSDSTPRQALIEHYLSHKDAKRALASAQEAVAALPQSADLLDLLGRAQAAAGENNQAINSFRRMAALQPGSPQPFLRLAGLYGETNDIDEARRNLKRALAIKPDLLAAQRALVRLELKAQRPDEALAVARTVRKQRPADLAGFLLEGDVENFRKNPSAAAEIYRAGLKEIAAPELAVRLHAMLARSGKAAEADKLAADWLKAHPKDAGFLAYLGEVALTRGDYQTAEGHLLRADQLMPGNVLVMNNLAWAMLKLAKPGAVAYAQKAVALSPDTPVLLDTLALALASDKQLDQAIATEKKALSIAPNEHSLRLTLAKLYIQAGDKAAARAELERLSKVDAKLVEQAEVKRLLAAL